MSPRVLFGNMETIVLVFAASLASLLPVLAGLLVHDAIVERRAQREG